MPGDEGLGRSLTEIRQHGRPRSIAQRTSSEQVPLTILADYGRSWHALQPLTSLIRQTP